MNLTPDAHPIHVHLVQFQLVRRRGLDAGSYRTAWLAGNGGAALPYTGAVSALDPTPFLTGAASVASAHEQGWIDTVVVAPAEVLTIRVRFAPVNGAAAFPFDATAGPGFVWQLRPLDLASLVISETERVRYVVEFCFLTIVFTAATFSTTRTMR